MEREMLAAMITKFRTRAARLRHLAYTVLVLIALTLGGGVYLFVIAGELVSRETFDAQSAILDQGSRILEELSPDTVTVARQLTDFTRTLAASSADIQQGVRELSVAASEVAATARVLRDPAAAGTQQQARAEELLEALDDEALVQALNAVSRELPVILNALSKTSRSAGEAATYLPEMAASLNDFASGEGGVGLVISTLATRVGALLVLIFLVQILINLYRYNIRLSAFFDARADALALFGDRDLDAVDLPGLISALSPDNLDFGKAPSSPAQHAIDLARDIISRQPRA